MAPSSIKTVIAFDYGLHHIGVAVGTRLLQSAQALNILRARDGVPRWDELEKLLKEWRPDAVIVGLPLNMDGSESAMSARARKFAGRLQGRFGVQTHFVDERLSSYDAKTQAAQRGHAGDYIAEPIDSDVAALLLASWWRSVTPTEGL